MPSSFGLVIWFSNILAILYGVFFRLSHVFASHLLLGAILTVKNHFPFYGIWSPK